MGAEGGLGIEITQIPLDGQPLDGVGIVAAPDLRAEAQHAKVKPVAAGGAAFQQNFGPGTKNPAKDVVKAQNVVVGLGSQGDGMAVHVPLDVGNGGGVQNAGHIFHNVVPDLRLCQIQQQLIPSQNIGEAVGEGPVRVGPVQVRIRVHGLRLKPEAEFQSPVVDLPGKAGDALGQLLGVHIVIAQARPVVIALAEPAVVQNEELAAQLLGPVRQVQQTVLGEVEHAALPAVIEHGPGAVGPVWGYDVVHNEGVHIFGQSAEAMVRYRQHPFRSLKMLSGCQRAQEVGGVDALHHPGQPLLRLLGRCVVVAGIDQIEAVNPALGFGGVRFIEQEAGIVPVGRGAGEAFVHHLGSTHGIVLAAHLCDPAAVEGGHGILSRQVHGEAHKLAQGNGSIAGVFQHRPPHQGGGVGGEVEGQLGSGLLQGDFQGFFSAVGLGQAAFYGRTPFQNLGPGEPEVGGHTAQFQGAFPVISPAAAAPGKTHHIGAAGAFFRIQQHAGAPAQAGTAGEAFGILCSDGGAKVKLL